MLIERLSAGCRDRRTRRFSACGVLFFVRCCAAPQGLLRGLLLRVRGLLSSIYMGTDRLWAIAWHSMALRGDMG